MKALDYDGRIAAERFRVDCARLSQLNALPAETFHKLLLDTFELALVPRLPERKLKYDGRSAREGTRRKSDATKTSQR
jgi:hypothetical protein